MDLTIDLAHEKGNQLQQRNDIFDGTEIIVGTPKRLYDLYIQNGINLKLLKLFAIDDAHETLRGNNPGYMIRMAESLPNCQVLMCAQKQTEKIDYFINATEFGFQKLKLG
jgi:superfamily II DNA/RNA helicase